MKFYTIALGPILFETRFKHFLDKNSEVLDHFTWVSDNKKLYDPYRDKIKIIDLDSIQKNHKWSLQYEKTLKYEDPKLFAKNFTSYCAQEKNYLPLHLQRFALLDFIEKNILKFCYVGSNVQITKNRQSIVNFFESIPVGSFITPYWKNTPEESVFPRLVKDELQRSFPDLKIPSTFYKFDGWGYGFSFKSKDDLSLFYELWEKALEIYFCNVHDELNCLGTAGGVSNYEQVIGFVMNIFVTNFNYKYDNIHNYWQSDKLGMHLSLIHDTWFYGGIRCGWLDFGFELDDKIETVSDFILRNREPLEKFYERYADKLNYKILVDNVELRYKF